MNRPKRLLVANVAWAHDTAERNPEFFRELARGQNPHVLWIGCSDSRVPAETITHCEPGDLFVHRNIANLFNPDDDNSASVLEYAVRVLKVAHVIVCGHYGCGGVTAALEGARHGLIDNWLRHVADVAETHSAELAPLAGRERLGRLCELNVVEQVANVCRTTIVEDAWAREEDLTVHGLVYDLEDGLLRDLAVSRSRGDADGR